MKNYFLFILLNLFFIEPFYSQHTAGQLNDSAMAFYKENPNKAILLLEKAAKIAQSKNDTHEYYTSKNYCIC